MLTRSVHKSGGVIGLIMPSTETLIHSSRAIFVSDTLARDMPRERERPEVQAVAAS